MKRILTVPLFPLPRVVLFPGVMLPFYIFEKKYRQMLADSLDGPGYIAIPTILHGFEGSPGKPPITHVFGVGSVEHYETHEDGTSDVQILGRHRVRLLEELPTDVYRRAQVEVLDDEKDDEEAFASARTRLNQSLGDLLALTSESDLKDLLRGLMEHEPEPSRTINILATLVVADIEVRQSLLEEDDIVARGLHLATMIDTVNQELRARGNLGSREEDDRDPDL